VTKDFEELFACLTARNVKALIVGGYAVAFHAKPRFTKDIDIFVDIGLSASDFTAGRIVQLGVAPNRVDLLTVIDGVTFDEAWAGRAAGHFGKQPVSYIGRADLIRNKASVRKSTGSG
jgi:hypothetical protein